MCLFRILKRWPTTKIAVFCQDVFSMRFGALILNVANSHKSHNDIKFCKETKTIIVVNVNTWLNSLTLHNRIALNYLLISVPCFAHLLIWLLKIEKNIEF